MSMLLRAGLVSLLVATLGSPALAAWPNSPLTNLPVCTAANNQQYPAIVSDGAGGAIVTWQDYRGINNDIYAQHVLVSGAVDPAWPADGRALCTAVNGQQASAIVSDGAGGAIVAWQDYRGGTSYDIYAQHVLVSGAVDPAWPTDGRALCTVVNNQTTPTIAADGAGGAIVTWIDSRNAGNFDIYAQHVLASGAVDAAWPADGRALCTAVNGQEYPVIVSDGAGGGIVTWADLRSGVNYDIYAQHVLASGAVDGAWPADGRALCTAASDQYSPTVVSDGGGGAIVTWQDYRSGTTLDIYAQHVLASGTVDAAWPADGRALCTAASPQQTPQLVSDGAGGAIVTWQDYRSGTTWDIYAQHVLASGTVDAAWPADGRALCTAANTQQYPQLVSDGAGGAIVSWMDYRSGTSDIYAQHVLASGAVDGAWPADGRALCTGGSSQNNPRPAPDGAGGAIVAWFDGRSGNYDIYAQRVARYGYLGTPEAEMAGVKDVPNDNGGRVRVSWTASYLEFDPYLAYANYYLFRAVPTHVAAQAIARGARAHADSDTDLHPGDLVSTAAGSGTIFWEYVASVSGMLVPGYSYVAPTTGDSLGAGNPKTLFMVQTRAGSGIWNSPPDSGYSVDNLPPVAPAPFTGQYAAGTVLLHWNPNAEGDLAGYRLYRGTSASFVPGPGNLVAALADTGYTDAAGSPHYYKLTAVDAHGNESPVATLLPAGTLGVDGGAAPLTLSFASPSPNPAGARTTLRYALPRAGTVRLAVYDAAGRLVRELASGAREPGEYAESWDLRDTNGRTVSAGLYFARFEAQGRTLVRRVAVTR
jgi:hypothetical protein